MRASRNLWLLSGFSAGLLLANLLTHPQFLMSAWQRLSALITSPHEAANRIFNRLTKENHP